jgi:UDPglucose 6-dehydrogenase
MIAYVGMTHLGLVSAAAATAKGFRVIGFDPDTSLISSLKQGNIPVSEPLLSKTLTQHQHLLQFTSDASHLQSCDLVYLSLDIPTDDQGVSDLKPLRTLLSLVLESLKETATLVILSQIPPGFTRSLAWPETQRFYQVETLVFGTAIERALHPERFIVGSAHPEIPLPAPLLSFLQSFSCPIFPMKYESAELSKIAINLFLASSVSTTNALAELCEQIGADWAEIVPTLRLDRRIGQYAYLSPGLGFSGGNLERDFATFSSLADLHGTDFGVVRSWLDNSRHRRHWVLKKLHEEIFSHDPNASLTILGLAYKKDTSSIKNSPALALLSSLGNRPVTVYDPVVKSLPFSRPALRFAPSIQEACRESSTIVVMTPWDEFRLPSTLELLRHADNVIDPFGILSPNQYRKYCTLGAP